MYRWGRKYSICQSQYFFTEPNTKIKQKVKESFHVTKFIIGAYECGLPYIS